MIALPSFFLLPSLPGLCYFMKEIVSRTDVAFCNYARSIVLIKIVIARVIFFKEVKVCTLEILRATYTKHHNSV
jgi:DNA polymerase III epsilon subunit-like protein